MAQLAQRGARAACTRVILQPSMPSAAQLTTSGPAARSSSPASREEGSEAEPPRKRWSAPGKQSDSLLRSDCGACAARRAAACPTKASSRTTT